MRGVETVPGQMPGDVRAHEVDTQQTQIGLELKGEETDVRDLLDVPASVAVAAAKSLQVGGMPRHAQVRVGRENGVSGDERDDLRASRSPEPGDEDAPDRLRRVRERHRNEGRPDAGCPQVAPERRTRAAGGALQPPPPRFGFEVNAKMPWPAGLSPVRNDDHAVGVKAGIVERSGPNVPSLREPRERRKPTLRSSSRTRS